MTTERVVRIFAGAVVLLSLLLGAAGSPLFLSGRWLWLAGFVGFMLFQSGITRLCPMELILKAVGLRSGCEPRAAP